MGPVAAGTLASIAALALAGCARVQVTEQSVFLPRRDLVATERPRLPVTDFSFRAGDGTRLHAWYLAQPGARATVLLFGGNAFYLARSSGFVEAITAHPVNLFMFDYRGYGESEGSPSVATFRSDALQAYDVLVSRFAADPRRIMVHGHSLGTFAATLVASKRPVAGLVLQNPATDGSDVLRYVVPWYARPFVRVDAAPSLLEDSNLRRIAGVRVPTLILAGGGDRLLPAPMARALYAASPAAYRRLVVVARGGHNDLSFDPAVREEYGRLVELVAQDAASR
jgi:uncharacterized protein